MSSSGVSGTRGSVALGGSGDALELMAPEDTMPLPFLRGGIWGGLLRCKGAREEEVKKGAVDVEGRQG